MLNAIETIARQAEAYLGHLSSLHRLGLDSVETAAKINAATGHKFIAQLSRNADAITSGKTSDLLVGWNKMVAEHWEASTGYTLQAQQEFLVIVERMTLGSTTKKS